jgi:hypothetical protein
MKKLEVFPKMFDLIGCRRYIPVEFWWVPAHVVACKNNVT